MKSLYLIILLTILSTVAIAQIKCSFEVLSEIEIDEDFAFVEDVFGDGETKKYRNRIITKAYNKGVLDLLVGTKSMERGKFFCEAKTSGDTLKIQFRVRGILHKNGTEEIEIGLFKYREAKLNLSGLRKEPKVIVLNWEVVKVSKELFLTFPLRFDVIEGDTINRKDKYGQRQGKWIDKTKISITESHYKDSRLMKAIETTFYTPKKIKSEYFYNRYFKEGRLYYRSYFETGAIQEENYKISRTGIFKRKWYANGNKFQENLYNGVLVEITQFKENGIIDCVCEAKVGRYPFSRIAYYSDMNVLNIPCIFYDEKGAELEQRKVTFKLNYEICPRQ